MVLSFVCAVRATHVSGPCGTSDVEANGDGASDVRTDPTGTRELRKAGPPGTAARAATMHENAKTPK